MPVIDLRPYSEPHYMHYKYAMLMMPICLDAKVIVETGFQDGTSTNIFLKALSQLPGERELYTFEKTDHSTDSDEINQKRNKAQEDIWNKYNANGSKTHWHLLGIDSVLGAKEFRLQVNHNLTQKKIDFLYLDSDHGLDHVYNELVEWSKYLSDKAIIMVDDAFDYDKQIPTGPMISSERWMKEENERILKHNEVTVHNAQIASSEFLDIVQYKEWKMLVFPEKHGPIVMYR
jgi:predicted O-methyltransferase YrrM